jgi:hypothetical protein
VTNVSRSRNSIQAADQFINFHYSFVASMTPHDMLVSRMLEDLTFRDSGWLELSPQPQT